MEDERSSELPQGVREGDVLIYMSGRLLIVDHLAPEAFTIDLVELDAMDRATTGGATRGVDRVG